LAGDYERQEDYLTSLDFIGCEKERLIDRFAKYKRVNWSMSGNFIGSYNFNDLNPFVLEQMQEKQNERVRFALNDFFYIKKEKNMHINRLREIGI